MYVPDCLQLQVLQHSHDAKQAGHFGFLKTVHLSILVTKDEGN